jgi:hypothetical protein
LQNSRAEPGSLVESLVLASYYQTSATILCGAGTIRASAQWLEEVVHDVICHGSAKSLANVAGMSVMDAGPNAHFTRLVSSHHGRLHANRGAVRSVVSPSKAFRILGGKNELKKAAE